LGTPSNVRQFAAGRQYARPPRVAKEQNGPVPGGVQIANLKPIRGAEADFLVNYRNL